MSKNTETQTAETSTAKEATIAKVRNENVVYVGPTIAGVATHNTVFNNGLPQSLNEAIAKEPAFKNLLVPISKLASTLSDISNKSGAAYVFYQKAEKYKA
jgi:hypothetical protein